MKRVPLRKECIPYIVSFLLLLFCICILMIDDDLRRSIFQSIGQNNTKEIYRIDVYQLAIALEQFKNDCGRLPTSKEGLYVLFDDTEIAGWKGPYVGRKYGTVVDEWGSPFYYDYSATNKTARLGSCGPDLQKDTVDDVVSVTYD